MWTSLKYFKRLGNTKTNLFSTRAALLHMLFVALASSYHGRSLSTPPHLSFQDWWKGHPPIVYPSLRASPLLTQESFFPLFPYFTSPSSWTKWGLISQVSICFLFHFKRNEWKLLMPLALTLEMPVGFLSFVLLTSGGLWYDTPCSLQSRPH